MIVVDASVMAPALTYGKDGAIARKRLALEELIAPHFIDLEVTSILRKSVLRGIISTTRAQQALRSLAKGSLERFPHTTFLPRIWELRPNVTPYDAGYIALAEAFNVPLLTANVRLAHAPEPRCQIEVLE